MGRAVLVFGPETEQDNKYWIIKFKIIDLNKIADTLKGSEENDWHIGMSDLEIVEDAYEISEDDFDNLQDFLGENNLTIFDYDFDESKIGFIVDNYADFSEEDKEKIREFCIKYELNSPTIFAEYI